MRRFIVVLSIFLFAVNVVCEAKSGSKNNSTKSEGVRIAFLGIDIDNLRSNYYTPDIIAEKMETSEDALDEAFSKNFFTILEKACTKTSHVDAVYCQDEEALSILKTIEYVEDGDELKSDLTAVPEETMQALFEKTTADYLVLIDQYYIKKEGYPYNNISHIIGYSVYDEDKKIVSQGRHQFTSLDIDRMAQYNKQFSKAANKLLTKIGN